MLVTCFSTARREMRSRWLVRKPRPSGPPHQVGEPASTGTGSRMPPRG